MPKVKCKTCLETDEKSKMIKEKAGYFHVEECHQTYIDHCNFKKSELEKWDRLYKFILSLHNIIVLPKANVIRLQALRNGEDIQNGQRVKKYKQGADYDLMYEAYLLAEKDIRWSIQNKLNENNDAKSINYCISVMLGKLNEAWKNRKINEEKEVLKARMLNTYEVNDMSLDTEVNYKKKKTKNDISNLL